MMRACQRRGGRLYLGMAVVLASVWGCGKQEPSVTGPATGGAAGRVKIATIGLQEDQFYRLIDLGMKDAAQRLGVDLSVGNSSGSLDKEISLIDTFTAQKVKAIVIAPQSTKASIPALQR